MQILPAKQTFGSTLGAALGQGFGGGLQAGLTGAMEQYFSQKKQEKETSALQKAFSSIPEDASFEDKFKSLMTAGGVSPESKKLALSHLVDYEKTKQAQEQKKYEGMQKQQEAALKKQQEEEVAARTYQALKTAGYDMPDEHIPGTPSSVYLAMSKKKDKANKNENYEGALNVLERQEELLKGGHLGPHFGGYGKTGRSFEWLPGLKKEGLRDRSEYEQLGKSLINYSSQIPIRNRLEFEKLSNKLLDATLPREEIDGTIRALKRIIQGHLKSSGTKKPQTQENKNRTVTVKTPTGTFTNVPIEKAEKYRNMEGVIIE